MRYFSAFAGIGGFDLGIDRAIPDAINVGFSEVDKYAIKIYKHHYPDRINFGDIKKIEAESLPDFDLFCGGFPCQDVSIAGKRKGLCGARSGLFFEIVRIVREKRPRLVFLENVKGLLSSNNGWDFARILVELDGAGYDAEWQVLNSKNFGVPQNRERVFIIGHSRIQSWKPVFPIKEANGIHFETTANCLDANYHKGYLNHGQRTMIVVHNMQPRSPDRPSAKNGGLGHLTRNDGITYCLDSNSQGIETTPSQIRRLTPLECERLQGFPDSWTEGISDTQRYKCLGNAVTVNVIEAIAKRLKEA